MPKRVAFVTIGQSPRSDVVPDILAETREPFDVTERGALDGLDDAAIADLAPRPGKNAWCPGCATGERCCWANLPSIGGCT